MSDDMTLKQFQTQVSDLLLRHKSFLDAVSKFQESNARVNRALMKAITECGCMEVAAGKQKFPTQTDISEWNKKLNSHLIGHPCDHCSDIVKDEMGKNLFYLTAICNLLEIPIQEIFKKELTRLTTLGVFNLR